MSHEYGMLERPVTNPNILAFIKCHLTSFVRWEILRVLAASPERWSTATALSERIHEPLNVVTRGLNELVQEGIVHEQSGPSGVAYCLVVSDPACQVVSRLLSEASKSLWLRRLIVSRILSSRS